MFQLAQSGERQGVVFFICLYALLSCGYSFVYQSRIARWPMVWGELQDAAIRLLGAPENVISERDYRAELRYRYAVAGQAYSGRRLSPWLLVASHNARGVLRRQLRGVQRDTDGRVAVFYQPGAPAKSYLLKPGRLGRGLTLTLAVVPALLYWQHYHG